MKNEPISSKSLTDWARVDAVDDRDIDFSDCPEITPEMFERAVVRHDLRTVHPASPLTLQIDQDVLDWFQAQGQHYQMLINALLRAYMEAHRQPHQSV
ncbi:MAG: BrnA antitoxin family protein [Desulfobulbaceae bacterium]|nr:BrnA antitoxin family protein [Desulfobulbaceae bacterium]